MGIKLKKSCLCELESLNKIYGSACKYFKSIDPDPQGTPPEKCITQGCLPSNGKIENYRILSIYLDNTIIGYCDYYLSYPDEKTVYISFLYIDELYRNNGYAAQVVQEIFGTVRELGYKRVRLTVSLKNWNGLNFWVKQGFNTIIKVDAETNYGIDKYGALEIEKNLLY